MHSLELRRPLLLLLAGLATLVDAAPPSPPGDAPLHPSAVTVQVNGQPRPIVSVVVHKPQIELDGKLAPAPEQAAFSFVRVPAFAPGLVAVRDQRTDPAESNDGRPTERYRATVVSDVSVPSAFLVLVVFDREFLQGSSPNPNTSVFFAELGELVASAPEEVRIDLGAFSPLARERMQYFPLIFTGGREIRTQLADLPATFFRRLELARHETLLANYLAKNAEADKPLQPYLRVTPILPRDTGGLSGPLTVNARLSVDAEGYVTGVELQQELPAPLSAELDRAMRAWLFLPKLEKGKPAATKARLPLQVTLP